jgi:isoquinoline 1-oxidoreductase alpha subunit
MELVLNGKRTAISVDPERPLLWVLRNELDLTGAKYGCGEGECGACTVMIDGVAHRSCITPVGSVAGRQITTIEGIADSDRLHPMQQAFIECDALQCGYCTAGMIVSSVALLRKTPEPSETAIKEALAGNVCRCGTYNRIIAAVRRASQNITAAERSEHHA